MWRRGAGAGLGVLALALLTGCSAPEADALPDGVRFEVMQGRTDYTSGTLVLRVVNDSPESLTVSNAVLSWPGFADPAEWTKTTEIDAGRTVDLRTAVPAPDCDSTADELPDPSLSVGFGNDSTVSATPLDPLDTLTRLHDTGCVSVLVDRTTAVSLTGPLVIDGSGADAIARLGLRFTPTGEHGTVRLSSVSSTPLLAPENGSQDWPLSLTVTAASGVQSVELGIRPARCDPHAIAEDKIGTVLVLSVDVEGVEGTYRYPVDDATRDALYGFVKTVCGMP